LVALNCLQIGAAKVTIVITANRASVAADGSTSSSSNGQRCCRCCFFLGLCHVSYSKTTQASCTLLYALRYFPEILPRGYRLGISRRAIVCLLVPILLDDTPCGTRQYTMRYLTLLLLFLTMLDRRLCLPVADNRNLDRWSAWVGLGARRCSLLFSTLYILYLTYSIIALQYSNYCYPVHILPYAYNIQNYTHQSTGRP
jgi:hypothetical protein